ncbi:MAG TPA: glycosyltransferase [Candidatus Nitrosotenuis sp.]|jgi:dolichyl-phosphate beta-glucosyltransferase|nr:glycosyltransferase [Candidatus Nitrosotenuis sp.]
MELSIVIPAYNEGKKIARDLCEAAAFLERHRLEGEILVVDDGSRDDTVARVEEMRGRIPGLRLLSYGANRGKGYALRHGVARSQGDYVLFADAGLCVPYEMALVGLTFLRLGMCDIAVANRRMRGSLVQGQPLYRRLGSLVHNLLVRLAMGVPWHLDDTQCGFKLFRGDVARPLFASVTCDGFMADVEMLVRAARQGHRILNFPVPWTNDRDTRFHPLRGQVRNFRELWAIRRALRSTPP